MRDDVIFKSQLHQDMLRDVLNLNHDPIYEYDNDTHDHWMSIDWKLSVSYTPEYEYYFTKWEYELIKKQLSKYTVTTLYAEWYVNKIGLDVLEKVYNDLVRMFLG